jgi:hypothetical protein
MSDTLIERLRDPRYIGQEVMRALAADEITSLRLHNEKLQKCLAMALNLLGRGVLENGHTTRKEWDQSMDVWEIEARGLIDDAPEQ